MSKKLKLTKPETETTAEPEIAWSFDHGIRCPRCGSVRTERTGQHYPAETTGKRQYRKCTVAVCRHKYSVEGRKI